MLKYNLFIFLVFQFSYSLYAEEQNSFYLLRINISDTKVVGYKIQNIFGKLKKQKIANPHFGDIKYELRDIDGNILYNSYFRDPRIIYTEDLRRNKNPDKKYIEAKQMFHVIKFPYFENIEHIDFFKIQNINNNPIHIGSIYWGDILIE